MKLANLDIYGNTIPCEIPWNPGGLFLVTCFEVTRYQIHRVAELSSWVEPKSV